MYSNPADPAEILDLVGLADRPDIRVKQLSGGQQRRMDLALGLVGDPELLFLDEPTTGFDPAARRRSWELVGGLRSLGKTILLTTHYMDEAQHLADRVAVMVKGRIVAEGAPGELMSGAGRTVISFGLPPGVGLEGLRFDRLERTAETVSFDTDEPTRDLHELTGWALAKGVDLLDLSVTRPSLEDVYLELAAESAEER